MKQYACHKFREIYLPKLYVFENVVGCLNVRHSFLYRHKINTVLNIRDMNLEARRISRFKMQL